MQRVSDHIRDIHWPRPSIETAMRLVLNGGGVVLRWYSKTIDGVWKLRIHPVCIPKTPSSGFPSNVTLLLLGRLLNPGSSSLPACR